MIFLGINLGNTVEALYAEKVKHFWVKFKKT